MSIPDQIITENELHLYNGDDYDRMYVAHKGIVYDVTDCPK
jgi:predicted heme/steroid binding protein